LLCNYSERGELLIGYVDTLLTTIGKITTNVLGSEKICSVAGQAGKCLAGINSPLYHLCLVSLEDGVSMRKALTSASIFFAMLYVPAVVFAQAFGEYGRAVGSVPHGKGITGSGPSRGTSHGDVTAGIPDEISRPTMPKRLVVTAKTAGLFPRQDEEAEKITLLVEGENLVPMVQSEGSSQWYMVKTKKGLVGWIKSVDVRQESVKK
jgi:hypothetical protein